MSTTTQTKCFGNGVHTAEMVVVYVGKHGPRYLCTAHAEQQEAGKTKPAKAMEVGTVLLATWGYDCTIASYYEVISATAKMVTVRKIEAYRTDEGKMPKPGHFYGEDTYKRRVSDSGSVKVTQSQWATVWDGKPAYETER